MPISVRQIHRQNGRAIFIVVSVKTEFLINIRANNTRIIVAYNYIVSLTVLFLSNEYSVYLHRRAS